MIKTTPHITIKLFNLIPDNPFAPDMAAENSRLVFWLRLIEDSGWGECSTPETDMIDHGEYIRYWHNSAQPGIPLPQEPDEIANWVNPDGLSAARSALDMALYDFIGKQQSKPLYELLGLPKPQPKTTAFTLCQGSAEEMAHYAKAARQYPILKMRLIDDEDENRLSAVRDARPDARIWIDAKGKWSFEEAVEKMKLLEALNVEILERPLAKDDITGLGKLQKQTKVTIIADEAARDVDQLEKLARAGVSGIKIKLMKVGGVTPAFQIAQKARSLGLSIMLSSTFESSLGSTATFHLSSLADWVNLDVPLNIKNDPFTGIIYDDDATISISDLPGIGVRLKE